MRILAVIPTLRDDPSATVSSIKGQTVGEIDVCVVSGWFSKRCGEVRWLYFKPDMFEYLGLRVSRSINHALQFYCLSSYDYLLRVDADVVLPSDFVEGNLKLGASYVGKAGYAMLINMADFVKVFGGRFPLVGAEDSYVSHMFMSKGYSNPWWTIYPIITSSANKRHPWRYHYLRGLEMYKLGYEPIHALQACRSVFSLVGYMKGLLGRADKYPFYGWVFRHQLRRIISLKPAR